MSVHESEDIRLIMPRSALMKVFDDCDGFDHDETGGRIIGTFEEAGDGRLTLRVTGIIEAGPRARRSRVSFFQDGKHQESIFRQIERMRPETEHLGNWHTHHVNGLAVLSGGDIKTYSRIVNHEKHNTSFFYALLVVAKCRAADSLQRYAVKHYVFRRNDERIYEIPQQSVELVDAPLVWPVESERSQQLIGDSVQDRFEAWPERAYDQGIIREFYHDVRPFTSEKIGLYWRGSIELFDGSNVQVILVEDSQSPSYSVVLRDPPDALKEVAEHFATREFPSARVALINTERSCNRALHERSLVALQKNN